MRRRSVYLANGEDKENIPGQSQDSWISLHSNNFKKMFNNFWFQCKVPEMVGDRTTSLKKLVQTLLRTDAKRVEFRNNGGEILDCTMQSLLEQSGLPEILFAALAPDRSERAEVYGFGNDDIDLVFGRLCKGLIRLAWSGRCDPEALEEGEWILPELIRGIREIGWEAKRGINPIEAANQPEQIHMITSIFVNGRYNGIGDVNNADAYQALALFQYNTCVHAINALEKISITVQAINQVLRDGPDQSTSLPSR